MVEWMRQREGGIELRLRLAPRASRNRVAGLYGDRLKIQLTAPPVGGAANSALIAFLSQALRVPRRDIAIVAGVKDRSKIVLLSCSDPAAKAAEIERVLAP